MQNAQSKLSWEANHCCQQCGGRKLVVYILSMSYPRIQGHKQVSKEPREMSEGSRDRTHPAMMLLKGGGKSNKWVRNRTTELGEHVRRFIVTEDSLFVVLWGGNKASEGGNGSRMMGGDEEEEGDRVSTALAETSRQPCSVYLQNVGLHAK